jgi:outer membrane protein
MKKTVAGLISGIAVVGAGLTIAVVGNSGAAKAEDAAKGRYGVVDMQSVILSVEEGKQARSSLEKEIKAKETELQKQKTELDKMNEEWKSQMALLSEEARGKKQQEFQEKFMGLRNAEMEFQNDIKRKEQKATQQIAMKVAGLVDKIAKERKLEVVFESNSAGLLYVENPVDLTSEVSTRFDKEGKAKPVQSAPAAKK